MLPPGPVAVCPVSVCPVTRCQSSVDVVDPASSPRTRENTACHCEVLCFAMRSLCEAAGRPVPVPQPGRGGALTAPHPTAGAVLSRSVRKPASSDARRGGGRWPRC